MKDFLARLIAIAALATATLVLIVFMILTPRAPAQRECIFEKSGNWTCEVRK